MVHVQRGGKLVFDLKVWAPPQSGNTFFKIIKEETQALTGLLSVLSSRFFPPDPHQEALLSLSMNHQGCFVRQYQNTHKTCIIYIELQVCRKVITLLHYYQASSLCGSISSRWFFFFSLFFAFEVHTFLFLSGSVFQILTLLYGDSIFFFPFIVGLILK